jgi:hypothetical protein
MPAVCWQIKCNGLESFIHFASVVILIATAARTTCILAKKGI